MAEISETPEDASDEKKSESDSDFDPKTMRKTKPGLKRLLLTITLLFSFLLGSPFLLKSIEIYRSPLPFRDIDSLSTSIESNPLLFPCRFQAVFLGFGRTPSTEFNADELGFSILRHMRRFTGGETVCGTCANNYTVSVTLDSSDNCVRNQNVESSWKCGAFREFELDGDLKDDEAVDEYLGLVLGGNVYSVVVVNGGDGVRAVVGKHRHAWIVGNVFEADDVVERIAEIFVKVFVNGGKEEGAIHGEFMPVGADGRLVLSFNLLNADPSDWIYVWYGV